MKKISVIMNVPKDSNRNKGFGIGIIVQNKWETLTFVRIKKQYYHRRFDTSKIVEFVESTLPYKIHRYYYLSKESIDHDIHSTSVCSDPMNGCPGDFAEAFGRESMSMRGELCSLEYGIPEFIKSRLDRKLHEYHDQQYKEQIESLPWLNGEWDEEPEVEFSEMPA